jgi:hypothetical protein
MDKGDIFWRGNEVRPWNISWTRDGYFEVAYVRENEEDTKKNKLEWMCVTSNRSFWVVLWKHPNMTFETFITYSIQGFLANLI